MPSTTDPVTLAGAELAAHAPHLLDAFRDALPRATDVVTRRLLGAAWREDLGHARHILRPARRHGFDRVDLTGPVPATPSAALTDLGISDAGLATELTDAARNLALGYARRAGIDADLRARAAAAGAPDLYGLAATLAGDDQLILYERLATEGHNLHPCGRTRLGWRIPDLLAHDQESPQTRVGFVAVADRLHLGDDLGALLRDGYPWLPTPPAGYRLQPVHAWQLATVLPDRYADLFAARDLIPMGTATLRAAPTIALRTVLLEPDVHGQRRYLKLSLDIQVTSTRRTISVASTRNGPAISALLHRLLAGEPRVLLLPEVAGAAVTATGGRSRDISAIVRGGLTGALLPGEVAIPGSALVATSPVTGRSVLSELLTRAGLGPLEFLDRYAALLLPPLLRLAASGVGLEAHLQNSIPTFVDGVPHRIAFRDFAGLRLHLPRLAGAPPLWPGSVVGTADVDVMRAKLGYTALQAHLGELVTHLVDSGGLDEAAAWRAVRKVLDEARADPADHRFLTAPRVPHKALVRMRLADGGGSGGGGTDTYVPVHNPLHAS
ncbi:IucA/IucC family protein [Rugosimonospora africana]|uniref:Iron transporter n=1 Tax=Rugosimonospora africana TaxID=556532 RepID=A0A8J3R4W5_9ACTN|nr:IucA/IucC family protein [Rugosimonospora africana]GIH20091.1 iron transporter [Rugosimonospora africana]